MKKGLEWDSSSLSFTLKDEKRWDVGIKNILYRYTDRQTDDRLLFHIWIPVHAGHSYMQKTHLTFPFDIS